MFEISDLHLIYYDDVLNIEIAYILKLFHSKSFIVNTFY